MKFQVPDMSCNHCVSSITDALEGIASEASVICDLTNRVVQINGAGATTPEQVMTALSDIGFDATLIEAQA